MYIGKRIKELRETKKLSLTDLSRQSGVQLATLSRIENEKMVGTVESHLRIAKALEIELTQLYKDSSIKKDRKPAEKHAPLSATGDIFAHNDQAYYEILTSNVLSKKMMPVLLKIEPGGKTNTEQNQEGTEKFIFVLEGEVEIKAGGKSYALRKDNTFYFDASLAHWFVNSGKSPAKVVCVVTPVAL